MNILCTGISCSGRTDLLREFADACAVRGATPVIFNVGDFMEEAARNAGVRFTEKVLDSDPAVLSLCRTLAMKEVGQRITGVEHAILSVHACFRWRGILIEGLTHRDLREFPADIFVNVVDDVDTILHRTVENAQWSHLTRDEVNVWLDEEEFLTRLWADYAGKPYYTIARTHPVANLHDLFFTQRRKCYLSYPITLLEETPDEIERIRAAGRRLTERFIVFDPLYIKDMAIARSLENVDSGIGTVDRIDRSAIERIKTRTVTRDYQFIRQSDFVVVIYPTDRLSPGVLSEMNFAHRHNKKVYAVYCHARSPFFELLCDRIFGSLEELETFLEEDTL
jgi:adenylate kinase